jgi:hypothetical protein
MTTDSATSTSIASGLCKRVLSTISDIDADAKITSVVRHENDQATLVRIRSGAAAQQLGAVPTNIVYALKRAWPLARVSLVENVVEGTTETQLLVPSRDEQRELAHEQALQWRTARRLRQFASLIALSALSVFFLRLGAALV